MATLITLVSFNTTDGAQPYAGVVVDAAGNLFGTTFTGGANNFGTVYEIAYSGGSYASAPTTLVDFNGTNGANPTYGSTLFLDASGNLFGTTTAGGAVGYDGTTAYQDGTVYEIANTGGGTYASTATVLVSFDGVTGSAPLGPLISDSAGNLFGTTYTGGTSNVGTIFELVNNNGSYSLSTLANFNGSNGQQPETGVIADSAGNLFGTTFYGGAYTDGTVYELVNNGGGSYASTPTTLASFSFDHINGAFPYAGLIADASGDLFGTTYVGGTNGDGTIFELVNTGGSYSLATLVSFDGTNGTAPFAGLIADGVGDLFGTTYYGGANGNGTVFELVNNGGGSYSLTTLASFDDANLANGAGPVGGLTADSAGNLFGTTAFGGASGNGTVFELKLAMRMYRSFTITSLSSGSWSTGGVWSTGHAPVATDDVGITGSSGTSLVLTKGATVDSLTMAFTDAGQTGNFIYQGGGTLNITGALTLLANTQGGGATFQLRASTLDAASIMLGVGSQFSSLGYNPSIVNANITNNGAIYAAAGHLTINGNITGAGTTEVNSWATLELNGADGQAITLDKHSTLVLDQPLAFTGMINGLDQTDTIDLRSFSATSSRVTVTNGQAGISEVTVTDGISEVTMTFAGLPSGSYLKLSSDGSNGTNVTLGGPTATSGSILVGNNRTVNLTNAISKLFSPAFTGDGTAVVQVTGATLLYHTITLASGASGTDVVGYTVKNSLGQTSSGTLTVMIDPGPSATSGTVTVGHYRTVNLTNAIHALYSAGASNDGTMLTSVTGDGAALVQYGGVTLTTGASGPITVNFTVTNSFKSTASGQLTVTVDSGPKTTKAYVTEQLGSSTDITGAILANVTGGLVGDVLSIVSVNSASLGAVSLVNGEVIYSASGAGLSGLAANATTSDSFTYVVKDQYGDTAIGKVMVQVTNWAVTMVGNSAGGNLMEGTGATTHFFVPGIGNTVITNGGNDIVTDGWGHDTVITATGNTIIALNGRYNTVTNGSGNLNISGGMGYDTISLGSGNSVVAIIGSHNVIDTGTGNNTISFLTGDNMLTLHAGGNDTITGMSLTGGDVFNLGALLNESGLGDVTTASALQQYVHVIDNGNNAILMFDASGKWAGGGVTIATLEGVGSNVSFSQMNTASMFHL